jgi:hypothetical protein
LGAILLMTIGGYSINGLLVAILLVITGGYSINGLLVAILLMVYWWLFY